MYHEKVHTSQQSYNKKGYVLIRDSPLENMLIPRS